MHEAYEAGIHTAREAGSNDITMHGYRQSEPSLPMNPNHCHCDGRSSHPSHIGPFADPSVKTVLTFGPKIGKLVLNLGRFEHVQLVRRQDRHDDGSVSTTYYLELSEDQYRALGGE